MRYTIDYGCGIATLFTPHEDWKNRFYALAEQCFGIRKSIFYAKLLSADEVGPQNPYAGEYERLEHDGDIIIWDAIGEKIKSEWD